MTREQKYAEQMRELGIYQEVFEPEIHTLAILERDLQRLTKRWKEAGCPTVERSGKGPATSDKTLDAIMALRKEILAHRDALGLTPKALRRIKGALADKEPVSESDTKADITVLGFVQREYGT